MGQNEVAQSDGRIVLTLEIRLANLDAYCYRKHLRLFLTLCDSFRGKPANILFYTRPLIGSLGGRLFLSVVVIGLLVKSPSRYYDAVSLPCRFACTRSSGGNSHTNNTGILGVESLDSIASEGDQSGHDLGFISALKEGVIGVNRQPSKSLEFNRQPSKLEKFNRQGTTPLRPS